MRVLNFKKNKYNGLPKHICKTYTIQFPFFPSSLSELCPTFFYLMVCVRNLKDVRFQIKTREIPMSQKRPVKAKYCYYSTTLEVTRRA